MILREFASSVIRLPVVKSSLRVYFGVLVTAVHSERTRGIDPKFSLGRALNSVDPNSCMTHHEASHRVRITQQSLGAQEESRKIRELRWQTFSKGLKDVLKAHGMSTHSLVIFYLTVCRSS